MIMRGELSPVLTRGHPHRAAREEGNDWRNLRRRRGDARVFRQVPVRDKTHLVDIVGTGGDGAHTFNISTCADVCDRRRRRARSASTAGAA